MEKAGEALGLAPEQVRLLTAQTALGAAKMAMESEEEVAELRRRVTSPGGTTEQGINALLEDGIMEAFSRALHAASNRSKELAEMLGGD